MKKYVLIIACLSSWAFGWGLDKSTLRDIKFWLRQFDEHADFAASFTSNANLQNESDKLHLRIRNFKLSGRRLEAISQDFGQLSKEMKQYQNKVRHELKKYGSDDSENVPLKIDILDHMNEETDYAAKKAAGKKLSKEEEAAFWSIEHEGQAKVISALSTSQGQGEKQEADQIKSALQKNHGWLKSSQLKVVERANEALDDLSDDLDQNPSRTKVPAKLAQHEKREREYAAQIFQRLDREQ